MNVLFLSPAFPPNLYLFCTALAARGARVFGLGDSPPSDLRPELRGALSEYVWVPSLADAEVVYRATAGLISRHGRIDRLESLIELWLDAASRLRDDFNVPGLREAEMRTQRSKTGMAGLFAKAGIAHPPGERAAGLERARAFAERHGYPLIFKPDTGAGAVRTFTVASDAELERAFDGPDASLAGHIMQPFIQGDIVTFDGLADREGRIVFFTSHRYDTGIMQVVSGALDGHYFSLREVPPALEDVGRRALAAFDVRERFFHLEFFETPGGYVALEMNLRPPGGFTTDMMNYACDFDVYDLWAAVLTGASLEGFTYERRYHTAHAGRRDGHRYRLPHAALVEALGERLVYHRRLPREFAAMQGDEMYLLRHPELDAVKEAIALVQEPSP
jgi:hypothetical protein